MNDDTANALSLTADGLTPVAAAATSWSRIAMKARPSRIFSRLRVTTMNSAADDQQQEVPAVVGGEVEPEQRSAVSNEMPAGPNCLSW